MKVVDYHLIPDGAKTKTMQDMGNVLGQKPEMSKTIVSLYPGLTLQKITEQLGAVYSKPQGGLKEIESFAFEWMIKTNQIPRIKFAEDCNEDGSGGAEFRLVLERKFYDPRETFELDNEQQLFVTRVPRQLAPNKIEYWVKLVGSDSSRSVNTNYMKRGMETKYVSNYQPELSERGYNKHMFNIEKHRNYISRHRVGDSFSGDWANLKKTYLEHAGIYFEMKDMEKDLLDLIYLSMENSMLLGPGNFDDKGNCLITEADGRPIPMGEGLIPQARRFCGQQRYFNLSRKVFVDAINDVVAKKSKKTGNNLLFMCNWLFYQQAQEVLDDLLKDRVTDNYFYDVKGNKIKVGAEYNAYSFAGNTITFMENQALTERFPEKGFAILLDPYTEDGQINIQMMTMKNMSLFRGFQKGMGGMSGHDSGEMSTTIHGGRIEYMGYRGIKLANPYGAHIMEQNIW